MDEEALQDMDISFTYALDMVFIFWNIDSNKLTSRKSTQIIDLNANKASRRVYSQHAEPGSAEECVWAF
jgi:hypothetical protein